MYVTYFYKFRNLKSEDVNSSADFAHIDALMEFEVGLISTVRFLTMPCFFRAQPLLGRRLFDGREHEILR